MLMRARLLVPVLAALSLWPAHGETLCDAVADAASGRLLKQDGRCNQRVTPASSFKIAISLMGYDFGFLRDEHSPALPFRKGYADWNPAWRTTTDPTSWIRNSVVWFSQRITESLGVERFQRYVTSFRYGNEDVAGDPGEHNGLTHAWLSSSLKISPLEQLTFLEKIVKRQLPVTAHAYEMTNRITAVGERPGGWEIHGKTGTGFPVKADGTRDSDRAFGWFVGWAIKGGRTLVFARLIQDNHPESVSAGLRARDGFLAAAPQLLHVQ